MTIVYVNCEQCGDQFKRQSKETWKKLCVTCWVKCQRKKEQQHKRQVEQEQRDRRQEYLDSLSKIIESDEIIEGLKIENQILRNRIDKLVDLTQQMT